MPQSQQKNPDVVTGGHAPAGSDVQPKKKSGLAAFVQRAIYGVAYAVIFMGCLVLGRYTTALFIAIMAALCCQEFFRMVRLDGKVPNEPIGLLNTVLFPLAALGRTELLFLVMSLLMVEVGLWYVTSPRTRIADMCVTLFGPIYTGLMLSAVVLTRGSLAGNAGALLSVGVCATLWLSDSFAYMVGSKLGRHKMVPKISPNKSWEGFVGGLVGGVLVWVILWATGWYNMELWLAVLVGILITCLGVIGDLIESRLKRAVGVKDSGNLMPGHGGMLDRTDSLIFGGMAAYLILTLGGIL